MQGLREKLSVLLDKTENDDKLIAAQKEEIEYVHAMKSKSSRER